MHRFLFRGAGLVLMIACPAAALAADAYQGLLEKDIAAWEKAAASRPGLEAQLDEEAAWQAMPELFPAVQAASSAPSSKSALETHRDERTDGLLSVMIDGRLVTLRDVPRGEWYAPYVRAAAEAGIVSGYRDAAGKPTGEYKPAQGVSIEELAKIAVMMTGGVGRDCLKPANPAAAGRWSEPFIGCAEARGWSVYADAAVDVTLPATRAQVIVTVLQSFDRDAGEKTGTSFTDVTLSTEFGSYIEKAKADAIVSGYADAQGMPTGLFGPGDRVSRAEMAKIAVRAMQTYAR